MRLIKLFVAFAAAVSVFVSCEKEKKNYLDEVQVSSSYVCLDMDKEENTATITVTAIDTWSISTMPQWLTITPSTGSAGETKVTFSAGSVLDGRSCDLVLTCAGREQIIKVQQGLPEISNATCAEVIAGPDSKTYRITGVCTAISNTSYGNWYCNDGTGEVYIYGTVDDKGKYNWSSFNIEVGDEVTVQGPKTTYGSTVELVGATFISVSKSLIKCDSLQFFDSGMQLLKDATALPLEGGYVAAYLTCKGVGIQVEVPEDAAEWLSISNIETYEPSNAAYVLFKAAPNAAGDRSTTLNFHTVDSAKKEYSATTSFTQKGAIIDATCSQVNEGVDGTIYRVSGYIYKMANTKYGNYYLTDHTDTLYVYGTLNAEGKSAQFASMGINEGDIVTVTGPKATFKESPQIKNVSVESHKAVTDVTVAEFLSKEDSNDVYYRLKGTVSGLNAAKGRFDISDESGKVYAYNVAPGYGGKNTDFSKTGVQDGDNVTIVGCRGSYGTTQEVVNPFFAGRN